MKTRFSTRPDCFRVSFVLAHVAHYWDGRFTREVDANNCARRLIAEGATRASVLAVFGDRTSEIHRFTKGA